MLRVDRLRQRRLRGNRSGASGAVATEDLLEVLDVDVAVLEPRLEVVPRLVQQVAEERAVVRSLNLVVSHGHRAVEVHVALEDADGDGDIRAVGDHATRTNARKEDLTAQRIELVRAERVTPDVGELATFVEEAADRAVVVTRGDAVDQV